MITPEVYEEFRTDVLDVINNQEIFTKPKIKVLVKQMGIGKSYFQGKELSSELYKVFYNQKFNIRVAPKNETCNDGIFEKETVVDGKKYRYRDITHIKDPLMMDEFLSDCFDTDNIYIFSITHARFSNHFESFLKYAKNTVLWIEEVHEFLAVGDAGSVPYGFGTGYRSGFDAKVALRFREWMKINGRVLAFTATPTLHQQEYDEYIIDGEVKTDQKFSDLFYKCNELAELKKLIPNQSWVDRTIQYDLIQRSTQQSVNSYVGDMIDSLIEREIELEELKKRDPGIQSKLTSLIRCGQGGGVWGCPIHQGPFGGSGDRAPVEHDIGMVQIVGNHLQRRGYDYNSPMIATIQEAGSGGNRIWNLNGEVVEKKLSWDDVKNRLNNSNDSLRHLIVVNRGGSGINVYNIGAVFIASVRDALWSREHIPCQTLGRGVRGNWGYGNIAGKYLNDLRNFISVKQLDGNIETAVNAIKTANKLDVWYPRGFTPKGSRTKVDVWFDSVKIFKETYCNSVETGYKWLHDFTETKPPVIESFVPLPEELLCPHCGEPVYYSTDKVGDGTLLPFFNMR
tara:strand:+ start:191 stop:1891 length:1701 start_codon:yes stop_codon:yes gene_type:complete